MTKIPPISGPSLWPTFIAFTLMFFSCISGSAWQQISFLNTVIDGRNIAFGVFGYTGGPPSVGYNISKAVGPINPGLDSYLGAEQLQNVVKGLITHLISATFALLAWAIMFWRYDADKKKSLKMRKFRRACHFCAGLSAFVAWIWDLALFGDVRNAMINNGQPAQYGNGVLLAVGAFGALLLEPFWSVLEPTFPEPLRRKVIPPPVV